MKLTFNRVAGVICLVGMLGCGPQAADDASQSQSGTAARSAKQAPLLPTSPERGSQDTIGDIANFSGIGSAAISVFQLIQGFLGLGQPSNADILNAIQQVQKIDGEILSDVQTIQNDINALIAQGNNLSTQAVEISISNEMANYQGVAVTDLIAYLNDPTQPVTENDAAITALGDATAAVSDFEEPASYIISYNGNGNTWTPIFAVTPLLDALATKLTVLATIYPETTFLNLYKGTSSSPGTLCYDQSFVAGLATRTKTWADSWCSMTSFEYCSELVCNPHAYPPGCRCLGYSYAYDVSCSPEPYTPSQVVATGNRFSSSAAAQAAGTARLQQEQVTWENNVGVPQLNTMAASLQSLVGTCSP